MPEVVNWPYSGIPGTVMHPAIQCSPSRPEPVTRTVVYGHLVRGGLFVCHFSSGLVGPSGVIICIVILAQVLRRNSRIYLQLGSHFCSMAMFGYLPKPPRSRDKLGFYDSGLSGQSRQDEPIHSLTAMLIQIVRLVRFHFPSMPYQPTSMHVLMMT